MGHVLNEHHGENASGRTVIEAHGVAHHIEFSVDHIRQEPKIRHTTRPSPVVRGTRITIKLPPIPIYEGSSFERDLLEHNKEAFVRLAKSYAWLNPHLSLRVSWKGEVIIDAMASNTAWMKWLPSWPTSPHWYDNSRFRRYMSAHIAHRGNVTVREFISEFRGMSGTAKQKKVLTEVGASHVSLHDFFGRRKANGDNIARLLAALKKHTNPVPPAALGVIGKEHLFSMMTAAGGDPETFNYQRRCGETRRVPHVVEFAFAVHRDGLVAGSGPSRMTITGVNWSPPIPPDWTQRRRPRRHPGQPARQYFAARHRRPAYRLSARGVHRPWQIGDRNRRGGRGW